MVGLSLWLLTAFDVGPSPNIFSLVVNIVISKICDDW